MPIMLQLRHYGFKHEGFFVVVFIVTYIVALLSYITIEKPFLMFKLKAKEGAATCKPYPEAVGHSAADAVTWDDLAKPDSFYDRPAT